jgi:polyisoprenoid-binding protein YceI
MKLKLASALLSGLLLAGSQAFAETTNYAIDPAHSEIDFSIRHMAISTVHGRFGLASGTILLDKNDPTKSSVIANIDATTLDTGTPQRDTHLKSADFFDTAKYPTATFKSTAVKHSGAGYDVYGDLTLHGVTKPVILHMDEPSKEQTGMDNKLHRGFSASTTLHRQDFGLTWNGTLKSGDNALGDDVKLTFEIEAAQQ